MRPRETAAEHIRNAMQLAAFDCAEPAAITARLTAALRELETGNVKNNPDLFDSIRVGDKVTIVDRFGKERRGVARILNRAQDVVVLNMGGAHGTPGIATRENVVRVTAGKGRQAGLVVNPRQLARNPARYLFTIGPQHLKRSPKELRDAIGRVQAIDIGKRVYDTGDGVWQVENDEQMRRRLGKNPRRRTLSKRARALVPRRRVSVRRSRRNPNGKSEQSAWNQVKISAGQVKNLPKGSAIGWLLSDLADRMLSQLARGIHENPTLAVLGNPPAKVAGTLSRRLYELRYQHADDGKDYRHPFGPGARVLAMSDGSVMIRAKHRLWKNM